MNLLSILALVFFVCMVIWVTRALLAGFSVPDPLYTVVFVGVVLVLLVALANQFSLLPPHHSITPLTAGV